MATKHLPALPSFKNPPLTEVVLSVQFDSLNKLQSPEIGLLWGLYRDRYPKSEQHPPIKPAFELFGEQIGNIVNVEISQSVPTPRCWYLTDDGSELIQV